MKQSTDTILMIRPSNFHFNEQTAEDNLYQNKTLLDVETVNNRALKEFDNFVEILKNEGINVKIFQDTDFPDTPDSIFPNNWFSTHNGKLVIYPMYAENRRLEVSKFKKKLIDLYQPFEIIDYSSFTNENLFLEGTGAIVLDRINKIAYSSLSQRSDKVLFEKFSKELSFTPFSFISKQLGVEVYHTNVIMSITSDFAIIALELVLEEYRNELKKILEKNKKVIELSGKQVLHFAGNCIELKGKDSNILILSDTAYQSLTSNQISILEEKLKLIPVDITTIQKHGGGSVRCMIAELF